MRRIIILCSICFLCGQALIAAPTNLPPSIVRGLSYRTNDLVVVYHGSGTGDVDNVTFWRANSNGLYGAIGPMLDALEQVPEDRHEEMVEMVVCNRIFYSIM
jgi:hypothetical protein